MKEEVLGELALGLRGVVKQPGLDITNAVCQVSFCFFFSIVANMSLNYFLLKILHVVLLLITSCQRKQVIIFCFKCSI